MSNRHEKQAWNAWNKGMHLSQSHKDKIAKARTHPRRIPGRLTDIEKKVLHLRILGYRHKQIAAMLYLEYQSVKNIMSRVYKILGVHDKRTLEKIFYKEIYGRD